MVTGSTAQNTGVPANAGAAANAVTVNRSAASTVKDYWTADRMKNAKPATPSRTVPSGASYGSSVLDFTRSRVSPTSAAKAAPYKTTGKLFFVIPGQGNFQCSASVIAKRLIITAAHCMYSDGVGFHTNWLFIPGYDGTKPVGPQRSPFGEWTWSSGQVPVAWINSHGSLPNNDDFGILVMVDQSFNGGTPVNVANKAGKYTTATGHLFDTAVTMLGYPCNFDSCNIMQRVDSSDHRVPPGSSGSTAVEYGSDMTGGSSGGPWVENFGDANSAPPQGGFATRNTVVGVTSYIYTDGGAALIEGASSLNANFTTIKNARCAAQPGNC
jgi:V8-like Glu-specific endopeptidase